MFTVRWTAAKETGRIFTQTNKTERKTFTTRKTEHDKQPTEIKGTKNKILYIFSHSLKMTDMKQLSVIVMCNAVSSQSNIKNRSFPT